MEAINNLHGKLTIIIIAHRISTVKNADRLVYMKKGMKPECGTYEELNSNSSGFKELVSSNL